MKTVQAVKWYRAAEAKKGRTIHLSGHARLGGSFAKCGKTLGRVVASYDLGFWNSCAACAIEQNKEIEREKKRAEMEAKAPAMAAESCEFCDIDGMGNHAMRCTKLLEARIDYLESRIAVLTSGQAIG